MLHVPYKGDTPAMQDVIAGRASFAFLPVPAVLAQVQAGNLKALAATSAQRLKELPQVPTMTELGFKDFIVEQWQAVYAPAGTPAPVVQRLNESINRILKDPAVVSRLTKLGITVGGGSPQQLAQRQETDYQRWGTVVKAAHITMN